MVDKLKFINPTFDRTFAVFDKNIEEEGLLEVVNCAIYNTGKTPRKKVLKKDIGKLFGFGSKKEISHKIVTFSEDEQKKTKLKVLQIL